MSLGSELVERKGKNQDWIEGEVVLWQSLNKGLEQCYKVIWSWDGPLGLSEFGQGVQDFVPLQWLFTGYGLPQGGGVIWGKMDLFNWGNFCWEVSIEGYITANTPSSWRNKSFSSERGRSEWSINIHYGTILRLLEHCSAEIFSNLLPKGQVSGPWVASGTLRYLMLHCEGVKVRSLNLMFLFRGFQICIHRRNMYWISKMSQAFLYRHWGL